MYLSRLVLNLRNREARRDLADCLQMHRSLMSAWPNIGAEGDARRRLGVLYRVEPSRAGREPLVLVQSAVEPDWRQKVGAGYVRSFEAKPIDEAYSHFSVGTPLRFRLLANPTRYTRKTTSRPDGQRIELVREDEKLAWLTRQGESHGFRLAARQGVTAVTVGPTEKIGGRQTGGRAVTIGAALFEGVLEVTDVEKFRYALAEGVGRGKAYGCGLLSVASAS